jgi:N-acetylglucosamine-6-phosphate deacetylase
MKKTAPSLIQTLGAVDLHFHGAFGVDLMTASFSELEGLSRALWKKGVAGFCATTLSTSRKELFDSVRRLGTWISDGKHPGAKPLGIHLEGPFLNSMACGAHPPKSIRKFTWTELEALWEASRGTLKILTLAPEILSRTDLLKLSDWAQKRKIRLSLGHSRATEEQAHSAFQAGFQGVTHAWNALAFHQRQPGALGAALGDPNVSLELIIDQVHVSPTVIQWTRQLHPHRSICFISDCAPATDLPSSQFCSFGPLKIHSEKGACRLPDGQLAGGGLLLPESYSRWLQSESLRLSCSPVELLRKTVHHVSETPLKTLKISKKLLESRQVVWKQGAFGKFTAIPVDSSPLNG